MKFKRRTLSSKVEGACVYDGFYWTVRVECFPEIAVVVDLRHLSGTENGKQIRKVCELWSIVFVVERVKTNYAAAAQPPQWDGGCVRTAFHLFSLALVVSPAFVFGVPIDFDLSRFLLYDFLVLIQLS